MPRKNKKLVSLCFFEPKTFFFFSLNKDGLISMAKCKVVLSGEAFENILYILAKTTQDTHSGKVPDKETPETYRSTNILLVS